METKIAKGKWFRKGNEVLNGDVSFQIVAYAETPEQEVSNAKLISAAPDLLEALQEFIDVVETQNGNRKAYEMAKRAIKKATE